MGFWPHADLRFLSELELTQCEYGAATCPVHPFICELGTERETLTGADVLAALKPRNFRSEHITDLNETEIPYPGYNPGTDNDEIHNDFSGQYIFKKGNDEDDENRKKKLKNPAARLAPSRNMLLTGNYGTFFFTRLPKTSTNFSSAAMQFFWRWVDHPMAVGSSA